MPPHYEFSIREANLFLQSAAVQRIIVPAMTGAPACSRLCAMAAQKAGHRPALRLRGSWEQMRSDWILDRRPLRPPSH
jgi:hypothetical protein